MKWGLGDLVTSICYGHLRRQLCPSLFHGTTKTAVEIGTEFSAVAAAEQPTSGNAAVDCALVQTCLEVELRW